MDAPRSRGAMEFSQLTRARELASDVQLRIGMKPLAAAALVSEHSTDSPHAREEAGAEVAPYDGGARTGRRAPLALASLPVLCQQRPARRGVAITRIRRRAHSCAVLHDDHRAADLTLKA